MLFLALACANATNALAQCGELSTHYGPYDYYRTFNLTFPLQALADLSTGLTGLRLPAPGTRLGLRAKYRSFDAYSPDAVTLGAEGQAYEIATYIRVRR